MTVAQRVRDFRYAKGWGPDELASRAEISRTALYQIECGKTETPRAGTLKRIARALDVSIEALLGHEEAGSFAVAPRRGRSTALLAAPSQANGARLATFTEPLRNTSPQLRGEPHDELQRKFRELLDSPLGQGIARIVEETHRLLDDRDA